MALSPKTSCSIRWVLQQFF